MISPGADPFGYIAAMDLMQQRFDVQQIVPGHGAMGGIEILDTFRQYFLDMQAAAYDDNNPKQLSEKYKDWPQIPFIMSPGATIHKFKNQNKMLSSVAFPKAAISFPKSITGI